MKKTISILLIIALFATAFPFYSFSAELPESGDMGESVYFTFDKESGLLTLSGTGESCTGSFSGNQSITRVVIKEGFTTIPSRFFMFCKNLTSVELPSTLTAIGENAFRETRIVSVTLQKELSFIRQNAFLNSSLKYINYTGSANDWKKIKIEKDVIRYNEFGYDDTGWFWFEDQYMPNTACSAVLHFEYNPALSHSYTGTRVIPATGYRLGYTLHQCTCGKQAKSDYVRPAGVKVNLRYTARSENAVKLTWNSVPGVDGYQLSIFGGRLDKTINVKTNSYLFKNLSPATCYYYSVRFYKKADNGLNYSSPWSKSLCAPTLPHASYVQKFIPAKNTIGTVWKQVNGVTGYQLQIATKANFSNARTYTFTGAKTLKYAFKHLSPKTLYFIRIRSYSFMDETNHFSVWSRTYKVKTK